jgi:hypothetical protein
MVAVEVIIGNIDGAVDDRLALKWEPLSLLKLYCYYSRCEIEVKVSISRCM